MWGERALLIYSTYFWNKYENDNSRFLPFDYCGFYLAGKPSAKRTAVHNSTQILMCAVIDEARLLEYGALTGRR